MALTLYVNLACRMKSEGKYWFGRKRIGFGFGPRTWQGWLVTLVYALAMLTIPRLMAPAGHHDVYVASMVGLTVVFFVIFFWKLDTRSGA